MEFIVLIAAASVLLFALVLGSFAVRRFRETNILFRQSRQKEENKLKIIEELHRRRSEKRPAKITNDEIQELLGISHATAARYFDELEEQRLVKQVGKTGRGVYYELLKV